MQVHSRYTAPVPVPAPDHDNIWHSFSTHKFFYKSCLFNVRNIIIHGKLVSHLDFLTFFVFHFPNPVPVPLKQKVAVPAVSDPVPVPQH